jgi:hypothetical protein
VQQAVAAVLAQAQERTNGHASPPPPPAAPSAPEPDDQQTGFCLRHQTPMTPHTDPTSGDRWYSHYDDEMQRYCKGAKRPRRNGRR